MTPDPFENRDQLEQKLSGVCLSASNSESSDSGSPPPPVDVQLALWVGKSVYYCN